MSSIVPSSSACMIDPNSIVHQATADSMVSLQQQVMAMQHHYPPPHFAQYPGMPQAFTSVQSSMCPTSSINAAAAAMAGSGCIPNPAAAAISRYPLIATHNAGYSLDEASNFRQVIGTFADLETDPRELERFAEHFKQRRIKLGVTQADVGKALAHLKMPGVGSLSQSTICRFESLTLSHNNMVALKPILHSWLEKAEDVIKNKNGNDEGHGILPNTEKKRKRTSIAAPEKRLLEDYFRQQPRPTGDRISAIAEKLDLKKNVVRVWFCNQRQKQKRSQFRNNNRNPGSSQGNGSSNGVQNGGRSPNSPTDSDHSDSKCPSSQPQALQPNPQQQQQPFAELNMEALGSLDMKAAGIGLFYQCNNQN
ncbi:homeobox domain-containing protein [Ditylenchus destructor]|nr:homeobox domain-containing protein [Ditylenchus destructor]